MESWALHSLQWVMVSCSGSDTAAGTCPSRVGIDFHIDVYQGERVI